MSRTRQSTTRETDVRDEVRLAPGEGLSRSGKVIKRASVTDDGNMYSVPEEIILAHLEDGFELEWKRVEVNGKPDAQYVALTARGGWEPVMAEKWPGHFLPEGTQGAIVLGGLMLMERHTNLCEEARREDRGLARQAANAQRDKLGIKGLPAGYEDPNQSKSAALQKLRFVRKSGDQEALGTPKFNYSDVAID